MKILTGYMAPSSGVARILGRDVSADRLEVANKFGYLPENGPLYGDMTPRSFLQFMGNARGMGGANLLQRLDEVIERCFLQSVIGKPISKLSKGFRQRVGLAQALLHDPAILIMDEPTAGLDPNQVREVRSLIRRLGESKTVLLSTHILQEVEAVAERVLVVNEGRIKFDGSIDEFRRGAPDLDAHFAKLTGQPAVAV
jgi:ABC-2 type transport system ATP-binding protein